MELRAQIKKLSLWIFIIPFIAINLCLFISVNYQIFDNTFLSVDQIGRSGPTFPYFDGGVSISRTARTYPTFLIFKPSMFLASVLLVMYWIKTNNLISPYVIFQVRCVCMYVLCINYCDFIITNNTMFAEYKLI